MQMRANMPTLWLEYFELLSFSLFFVIILSLLSKIILSSFDKGRLPPSPPQQWPLIGHLPILGNLPHQTLFHLSKKHGPLMTIKLGLRTTLVVSSPAAAKEVLHDNDLIFSSRPIPAGAKISFGATSLVWSPYGERWKYLRRISTTEIFSAKRLESMELLRREEVRDMVASIFVDSRKDAPVNIGSRGFQTMLGLMERMVYGKKIASHLQSSSALDMKEMVRELLESAGRPSLSDLFPFLEFFDVMFLSSKKKELAKKFDRVFDKAIEERGVESNKSPKESPGEKDYLQVLLEIKQQNSEFKMQYVKGMLMDMFVAGTDTSSSTVEWGLAELLKRPDALIKAQAELDHVIGKDRFMRESDIPSLPYLQAVVKETLRLHPPTPLLVPRRADADCKIDGFTVKKGTQVMVNIWGIARDENVWERPLSFEPERFVGSHVDFKGKDFEFIPFGCGRRICIGMTLASKMVHLMLGSLLQCFDWDAVGEEIDFDEVFGITLQKAKPLVLLANPRMKPEVYG